MRPEDRGEAAKDVCPPFLRSAPPVPSLPRRQTLDALVNALGWQAALIFTRRYGGQRIYVPQTITPEHPFAQLIGLEAAQALLTLWRGENDVRIPKADIALRQARNREIWQRRHVGGESCAKIAVAVGLAEYTVQLICKGACPLEIAGEGAPVARPRGDVRQLSLLDR